MMRILLNADIGERGSDHPTDRALLPLLDIANIACGGHAGDQASARHFANQANQLGIIVCAHLSYPDRENFGRRYIDISTSSLLHSLDQQRNLLPDTTWLKLHGALYNRVCMDRQLAEVIAAWARAAGFEHVLTLLGSAFAQACADQDMAVVTEMFAERRYVFTDDGTMQLMPRSQNGASLTRLEEAKAQATQMILKGEVQAYPLAKGIAGEPVALACPGQTICIHSDSPIALPLARVIRDVIEGEGSHDSETQS